MLSAEQLQHLDTFLIVGTFASVFFVAVIIFFCVLFFILDADFFSSKANKDDLEELEKKLTFEIKKAKDKELTAKECALLNMESDIRYIREKFEEKK